jgi:hexosaminidase
MKTPILLPLPHQLSFTEGNFPLSNNRLIIIDSDHPQSLIFSASRIKDAINSFLGYQWEIVASIAVPQEDICLSLHIETDKISHPQGYSLQITPQLILIEAHDEAGIYYGCCTLVQLLQNYLPLLKNKEEGSNSFLPCLEIIDWPDFTKRGVMLDISRDKVPTMDTILSLVDLLASWKINQFQLYIEHTFAYRQHPEVWADASPFTGEEIMILDAYCRRRFIELVPNQNSFGHLEKWLAHPRYRQLAEAPDGFDVPWGHQDGPFSLCPLDPGSLKLITSMYDELLPHFSSRQFNVGCDETFDLGQGRSQEECALLGTGRVYLDFLLKIYQEVKARGFTMQFWGDIIMAHPELVSELPKDSIALEWGYEADHPFNEHGQKYIEAGLPFYVCPGTSAWNSIAGRTDNTLGNLLNAAENGIKYNAIGYLITDWGDNGHWQTLPISYLGFAAGAAYSWALEANRTLDIKTVLDHYAFQDSSESMGKVAYDLGNVYHAIGIEPVNASALFYILQQPIKEWVGFLEPEVAVKAIHNTLETIEAAAKPLQSERSRRPDASLLRREFNLTAKLLQHACRRGSFGFGSAEYSSHSLAEELREILIEYQAIWYLRNRPGGLKASLAHFDLPLAEYQ